MNREAIITKYYKMGQRDSKKYSSVREATNYERDLVWAETEMLIAYEAGLTNCKMPYKVIGWRYGSIPTSGHSYNNRDDRVEPGVSLMATDCGLKTQDEISGLFIAASNRPTVKVEGWLNTVTTGSDGEPLVFWATEIN